jgi:hypothetical protein
MSMPTDPVRRQQLRNFGVVVVFALAYLTLMALPNTKGAKTAEMLYWSSQDENMTYGIVVKMLDFDPDIHVTWGRLIIYGDYHYGYPFYLASFLVLLPLRLILGPEYIQHLQLVMFLLRMFISVLPMLVAILLLVYLQTRFRSLWGALGMTVFLAAIPAIVRQNLSWWHPDALTILCVVLTIFFLERDRLRFGRFFWLAAAACGMATAIKLLGVWFVLTIPLYLLAGLLQKRVRWGRALLLGAGFTLVLAAVTVISNPFVFYKVPRERMLEIQQFKTQELEYGYSHDDPKYYQHGPQWWAWTLKRMFGPLVGLLLLLGGLVIGTLAGPNRFVNRLILSWGLPLGVYLLWFVAPKPDHYILPVLLPLMSAGLGSIGLLWQAMRDMPRIGQRLAAWFTAYVTLFLFAAILVRTYLPLDIELWLQQWHIEKTLGY